MGEAINSVAITCGLAESGKTTLLKSRMVGHLERGAFAFVQDPDRQFAGILPVYDSPGAYSAAQVARHAEGLPIERGAAIATMDEAALTEFVVKLGETVSTYVAIAYDEAVLLSESTENYVSPAQKNLLARRRHMSVAVEMLCQDFGLIHRIWQTMATDLFLFRTIDGDALKKASKRFGVPLNALEGCMASMREQYDYIHVRPGRIIGKGEK